MSGSGESAATWRDAQTCAVALQRSKGGRPAEGVVQVSRTGSHVDGPYRALPVPAPRAAGPKATSRIAVSPSSTAFWMH
eukprot:CAMPEP_0174866310 /NCGR_PEP_ID=MMETSP1114-20130205/61865_1 /TAXON_ID=312471 /ORGANISM="Neobodo designis, Strain CCAP 1951/1" /LENGTH=78 /DNA_ID=CAMNT_0016101463 /DNA_START=45 /DNA_END=278 /DNA_ORIENTATION=+